MERDTCWLGVNKMTERRQTSGSFRDQGIDRRQFEIELGPEVLNNLKGTMQEKVYLDGNFESYHLRRNPDNTYLLVPRNNINDMNNKPTPITPKGVYSFVIMKTPEGLDLIVGKGSHALTSGKAKTVKAAGDLYFSADEPLQGSSNLIKITDQSGSYHIHENDLLKYEKRQAAQAAMRAIGLPMSVFVPFNQAKALVFSTLSIKENRSNSLPVQTTEKFEKVTP
jgi:hypothetical protein